MNVVIVGGGMAGCKLAEALVNEQSGINLTLVSEEAQVGYNRIMLSSLLAGDVDEAQLQFVDIDKLKASGVTVMSSDAAISINSVEKFVTLSSGSNLPYDKLILATGSRPAALPIFNSALENVMAFRTLADVDELTNLPEKQSVAIIGAGLLGLEAAVGLAKKGHTVSVFHRARHIMNRQLDATAAQLLTTQLEGMGVRFILGESPQQVTVDSANNVTHLHYGTNQTLPVNKVILAVGITPEVTLAKTATIDVERAIVVNSTMQTSNSDIYALGECCEFEKATFGLVAPIWKQVDVVKNRLMNIAAHFELLPSPTNLKVSGVSLFSMGDISESDNTDAVTFLDSTTQQYRKLFIRNGFLVGAILYGDVADGGWYTDLILQNIEVTTLLDRLIFGQAYCESSAA